MTQDVPAIVGTFVSFVYKFNLEDILEIFSDLEKLASVEPSKKQRQAFREIIQKWQDIHDNSCDRVISVVYADPYPSNIGQEYRETEDRDWVYWVSFPIYTKGCWNSGLSEKFKREDVKKL